MTTKTYHIIMNYFEKKGMDRNQLEEAMDFTNLTMKESVCEDIAKLLEEADFTNESAYEDVEHEIRSFVRFVKNRSGSGDITWDEFIKRLKDLELDSSDFGIRVQRFSKHSYWEVWFNHFDMKEFEDGDVKLEFNHIWYSEKEKEDAYSILWDFDVDTDIGIGNIISQINEKWDYLSEDNREMVVSALKTVATDTKYVDKSRMWICKNMIESIHMTNADLVPQVGLRDYAIKFKNDEMIGLRF